MILLYNFNIVLYKIFINFYYLNFDNMTNILTLIISVFSLFLIMMISFYIYTIYKSDLVEFYHPSIYLYKGILYTTLKLNTNITKMFFMIYQFRNILF